MNNDGSNITIKGKMVSDTDGVKCTTTNGDKYRGTRTKYSLVQSGCKNTNLHRRTGDVNNRRKYLETTDSTNNGTP